MRKDHYLNLNNTKTRWAVKGLLEDFYYDVGPTFKLSDIRFDNKERMLFVKGQPVFRYDRHLHYPKMIQHSYAEFEFLEAVRSIIQGFPDRADVNFD